MVDDHGTVAMTFVTQVNLATAEVDGRFVACAAEAERVVFFDLTFRFGIEQLVSVFTGCEKTNS